MGTPHSITPRIRELGRVATGVDVYPVYLPIEADASADPLDCFANVQAVVDRLGGHVRYGWRVLEEPGRFLEAEFHAAWEDPEGRLHEVSPALVPLDRTLFIPDPGRTYQGRQVNSVRVALLPGPEFDRYDAAHNARFRFRNEGRLADLHGSIALRPPESAALVKIDAEAVAALAALRARPVPSIGRNHLCPCQSGQKFKRCCGV